MVITTNRAGPTLGEHYLQMGEAQTYMSRRYNITWSRPYIVKLVSRGQLRAIQPGGPGGWWYISRESIDELLGRTKPS